jgi:putative FmdB family regulatory protein
VPTYEYRCPNGHTFEVFQRMADAPVERCQQCGAGPVEKVLFPVAVHFKGSGFYSTDYGRGSRKSSADGDSGAGSSEKKEKKDASTTPATDSGSGAKTEKKKTEGDS